MVRAKLDDVVYLQESAAIFESALFVVILISAGTKERAFIKLINGCCGEVGEGEVS